MNAVISYNPSDNYSVIGQIPVTTTDEIDIIISNARTALSEWKCAGLETRANYIRALATQLKSNEKELAKLISLEMGMTSADATFDVSAGITTLVDYVEQAYNALSPAVTYSDQRETHTIIKEPVGIIAAIAPWNYPMGNFVWLCGQALLAGNVIIYKASEYIPMYVKTLSEIINHVLPNGVFQAVFGGDTIGEYLVSSDVNMVSFIGSTKTGIKIAKKCAERLIPVNLELGGSAPCLVFDDVDIEATAEKIVANRFANNGQVCDGIKRLIVSDTIVDELTTCIVDKVKNLRVGNPLAPSVDIGALASRRQLQSISEQVEDSVSKGAKILCGGYAISGGAFYSPTVLTNVTREMRVWNEEVFGPVLPIVSFSNISEAVDLANDTNYGLGGYVFSTNADVLKNVVQRINSDMISVNGVSYVRKENFFGGRNFSGGGRENGIWGFQRVTIEKIVSARTQDKVF